MTFPLWRYGAYAFAIAATLCLAAANVAWAWGLDDGVYRYVMIAVSVAADIGAPCALMAMMHHHGDKDPTSALAAFVVWAFCGYAEVKGAEIWLKTNSFILSAPALKATEAQKAASADLEAETTNLAEIRKLMAGERREARLDALQRREKAALERIEKLRPQTFTPSVEPARSQYAGNELALAFALWLLSQVAWKMAVGRLHGVAHATVPPAKPASRPAGVVRFAVARDEPPGAPGREPDEPVHEPLLELVGPDKPQGQKQHLDMDHKDIIPESANCLAREAARPRLALVRDEPADKPRHEPGEPADAFARKVLDYDKAGFSARQIARQLGCGRTKVQNVLKQKKSSTTQNGA
jgi:hypothetical protein